jgi:hypothetical protein
MPMNIRPDLPVVLELLEQLKLLTRFVSTGANTVTRRECLLVLLVLLVLVCERASESVSA